MGEMFGEQLPSLLLFKPSSFELAERGEPRARVGPSFGLCIVFTESRGGGEGSAADLRPSGCNTRHEGSEQRPGPVL